MFNTKSYYGFTANCTPMQRGRKEEQLEKLFRYDGKIFRFADFAVYMIFENGYAPITKTYTHGMINGYYGKEWGELSKPKTEYRLESDTESLFYTINKTLFEYCNYIIDTFSTISDAEIFAQQEAENTEKARLEEKARQEAERIAKEGKAQQIKAYKEWLCTEREAYTGTAEENLCKAIFEYCYGDNNTVTCCDVIILAKDIENPLSRQELINRLHNGNKASIKIFEHYTGIKLPKNQKERMEFLTTVQPEQYGEMTEFKPRKKADKNEKKEKQFDKYYRYNTKLKQYIEAYGEKISHNNMLFFAEKIEQDKHYSIIEATTGMLFTTDKTLTSLAKCKEKIKQICNSRDVKPVIDAAINKGYKSPLYCT